MGCVFTVPGVVRRRTVSAWQPLWHLPQSPPQPHTFAAAPFLFSPGDSGLSQRSAPAPLHGSCWEPSASPHEEA